MDVFDDIIDVDVANRMLRRAPVIRDRVDYFDQLDETDFKHRFRLSKNSVVVVYHLIENDITSQFQDVLPTYNSIAYNVMITLRKCSGFFWNFMHRVFQ